MIYWLSGSLAILILVTVLLTPESTESTEVDADKATNGKVGKTTVATDTKAVTNSPAQ
ncbi:MAG: hypothetical protein GQ553_03780 [Nitrosomonadaceae bacterium]|nr:hypothetical protein [Nitrosomonadaceae bacterium]